MKSKRLFLLLTTITFIVGTLLGIYLHGYLFPDDDLKFKVIRAKGFQYTSPLLYYDNPQGGDEFVKNIKDILTSYIDHASTTGHATDISIYLRYPYLVDWTVINGSEKYSPASLLKVPVMMVYFKRSELDPSALSTTLPYNIPDDNEKMNYKPQEKMEQGKSYAISDLIRRMIVYSDDTAENMLTMNINKDAFDQVFDDIQINRLNYAHQEDSMDVQTYSYFFRVLYNSTFLSRQNSEQALKLLSQTTFTQGLVAGVPKDVTVAHKFGERYFADTGIAELHDCGIIYFPQNPYLLCVMTRGTSFVNLEKVIKDISQLTYSYTKQQSSKFHPD